MKFIFADSLDYVDPAFDFIADRSPADRQPYWDDAYPHEILGYAPYDGVLVSRGIVGDHRVKGKYTASQARRFQLVGARKFLRLDKPEFAHLDIFGDCGAFTYVQEERPPYTPAEMAEFYDECGFTHGCSVDHIIFDFDPLWSGMAGGPDDAKVALRDHAGKCRWLSAAKQWRLAQALRLWALFRVGHQAAWQKPRAGW